MKKPLISIVVPIYNEERNIVPLYSEIKKQLKKLRGYDFEVLLVDDGSSDGSLSKIKKLQAKDERVHCIEFVRNFGKETATTAGINMASGAAVITVDADLQHPIELLPRFIEHWELGAEVVVGVRNQNSRDSLFRRWRSQLFYKLLNRIAETTVVPRSTDFQLLDRVVVDEFNRFTERGRITRGLVSWLGFPTTYVYFDVNDRIHGAPTYSTAKLIRLAMNSITSLSLFPLKIAGYLGIVISVVSGALGIFMLIDRVVLNDPQGYAFSGPAILAVIILFLVGILLSCLGLIALYIGNIHSEVTNRPLYVVRRTSTSTKGEGRRG
jgi:polyisoprenyl-phosphate glycosyltransferase